jgi:hypothetical protein
MNEHQKLVYEKRNQLADETEAWVTIAYSNFKKDSASVQKIVSCTEDWELSVALFPDGTHRILSKKELEGYTTLGPLITWVPSMAAEHFDNPMAYLDSSLKTWLLSRKESIAFGRLDFVFTTPEQN